MVNEGGGISLRMPPRGVFNSLYFFVRFALPLVARIHPARAAFYYMSAYRPCPSDTAPSPSLLCVVVVLVMPRAASC